MCAGQETNLTATELTSLKYTKDGSIPGAPESASPIPEYIRLMQIRHFKNALKPINDHVFVYFYKNNMGEEKGHIGKLAVGHIQEIYWILTF